MEGVQEVCNPPMQIVKIFKVFIIHNIQYSILNTQYSILNTQHPIHKEQGN